MTVAALALPAIGFAATPVAQLPPGWSHASVNVVGPKGQGRTVVYDRGKVTAVGPGTLTLKEFDGSMVTIVVASKASVQVNGRASAFSQIQPGDVATTMGIDGAPATQVQATTPPAPVAAPSNAPVVTQGVVVSIGRQASAGSVTLKEADGTIVTVQLAPSAQVAMNGHSVPLSKIPPGAAVKVSAVPGKPARAALFSGAAVQTPASSATSSP